MKTLNAARAMRPGLRIERQLAAEFALSVDLALQWTPRTSPQSQARFVRARTSRAAGAIAPQVPRRTP